MNAFNWICPYCDRAQTVVGRNSDVSAAHFDTGHSAEGDIGFRSEAIACSNNECNRTTVYLQILPFQMISGYWRADTSATPLFTRQILPEGLAKLIPEYVPAAIREDYREACLIKDQSPKASATLARRCLQGMIRDFGKVKPSSLFKEILALEAAVADGTAPRGVSEDSIDAITALRKVGNIGAHMEADVNVIVDVDANEAQVLIDLIESLIDDWYVETHKRQQRFAKAVALGQEKAAQLEDAKAGQGTLPAPRVDDRG